MNGLEYVALLLGVTSAFAYLNHYLLGLPRNSGLLILALATALGVRLIEYALPGIGLAAALREDLGRFDFGALLLDGFLAFLLFAAALEVDVAALLARKWTTLALATVGVAVSTIAMAVGIYGIFALVGLAMPFAYCLVFGALISPTDPVTVADVLRRLGIPRDLQAMMAGESLFNDGVGIVLFTVFLEYAMAGGGADLGLADVAVNFVRQAGGGALLGLATGGVAFAAIRGIDEYNVELMISLTLVTGTFGLAQQLDLSGPVAVAVAGLIIGSIGRRFAFSPTTRDYLRNFWSTTDGLLNAVLFLLIGLEFTTIELHREFLVAAALAVPLSLLVRGLSITLASLPLNLHSPNKLRAIALLTWSGLRGGISVALVLGLPASPYRGPLVTACYGVVIFTMLAQGLSLGRVATRLYPPAAEEEAQPSVKR
ncbi:MAG: cation:proton antiporter [Thiohalocapsa sp.]